MRTLTIIATFTLIAIAATNKATDEHQKYLKRKSNVVGNYIQKITKKPTEAEHEYTTEWIENTRRKRDTSSSPKLIRKKRSVSSNRIDAPFKVNLVSYHHDDNDGGRYKRATYNITSLTWPRVIPYKFNTSYPEELKPKLRRVMKDIMDHVCITWIEEPYFDPDNNAYDTNAHLEFVGSDSNICGTVLGQGSGKTARYIKTCTSYYGMAHELMHTLGTIHEQQGPRGLKHLIMNPANVQTEYYYGTYNMHNYPKNIETSEFDSTSLMMYSRKLFTRNGLDVMMPMREDEFTLDYNRRTRLDNNYMELNQVYKCAETFCNNEQVDCNLGYYTQVKGVCQCVCPDGFDYRTNCASLEDETSGPQTWPDVPFTLYAADAGICPMGFYPETFEITGFRDPMFFEENFFSYGHTTVYHMCTRDSYWYDMDALPMGTYCVVKPVSTYCNAAFGEGSYEVFSAAPMYYQSSMIDWTIKDNSYTVIMKFCCRSDRNWYYPIELPRQTAFRLISSDGSCPLIKGLKASIGRIAMFNNNTVRWGNYPQSWHKSYYIVHNFCTYTPPNYGCNEQVTLDANQRTHVIKAPGFDSAARVPNMRCLYHFTVPEGARIKVSMDTMDLASDDELKVRRFNKWDGPQMNIQKYMKKEFLTEKDFLFIEYWSGKSIASNSGMQLTMEVVLKEDNCFNEVDRGVSYLGGKWVTESFEECIPWTDATQCPDFPWGSKALKLFTIGNVCRNPDGMERPWCYVSVEEGMCRRAYCDVCNHLTNQDQLPDCSSLIAQDMSFCDNAMQRTKCSSTCGLDIDIPPPPPESGTCSTPIIPSDGSAIGPLQDEYNIGDLVALTCNLRGNEVAAEMECTEHGWPNIVSACFQCPPDGIPYADRCYIYTPNYFWIDTAAEICEDRGGRLFIIRNEYDLNTIRNFKHTSNIPGSGGSSWINALLVEDDWVLYTNNSKAVPYVNWANDTELHDPVNHDCAVMIWEEDRERAGQFISASCNLGYSQSYCEISRSTDGECFDASINCVNIIKNDPDFCSRTESYPMSVQFCGGSCGECSDAECVDASDGSGNYHRVALFDSVSVGQVMEFQCNSGYYLVSGNLRRPCGPNGYFLDDEPICSPMPNPVDVGRYGVTPRVHNQLKEGKAYLFDIEGYRIPFSGRITHWHYYGTTPGPIYFVIYRYDIWTQMTMIIGYNLVTINTINERWTYAVPYGQEIFVEQDDMYGVWTATDAGRIAATSCTSSTELPIPLMRTQLASTFEELLYGYGPFDQTECQLLSLGLRVSQ